MKRIPKITQENVHIFIPYKVAAIARRLNKDKNMPLNRAVAEFYNSVTLRCLKKRTQSIGTKALRSYMRTLSPRMGICDGI